MNYDRVLLISLDTLRGDCLGASPTKLWPKKYTVPVRPHTPDLDALAGEGAFFPNCVTAAPYTSASHASFFTGAWPPHHGVFEFFNRPLKRGTIFDLAKAAGYETLLRTDFPLVLGDFLGFDRGIDHFGWDDDSRVLEQLQELVRRERRIFACVHFGGIHMPYGFHNLHYGGEAYRAKLAALEALLPEAPPQLADQLVETYRSGEDLDMLLRYKRVVQQLYSEGAYDQLFELYLEGINHFCETRLSSFLSHLLELLGDDRTLLIVFGDHGEEYDDTCYGHHNGLSHGVLHVPVIVRGGGIEPGLHPGRVRSIDLAPTIVELCRLAPNATGVMDGSSLAKTLTDGAPYPERTAFAQAFTSDTAEFVDYQADLLKGRAVPGKLRHVLYGEAVYDANWRLSRRFYTYTEHGGISRLQRGSLRQSLAVRDANGEWTEAVDPARLAGLTEMLEWYNGLRQDQPQRELPVEIRQQLRAMGYHI